MSALLTDNLPLLAGAPNGIKKLRELILELAVRGKLVAQEPNDEPASELLKRIAEEKARLVAEGKIRKQKPLAGIADEEKPYDLPDSWEWVRLPEIYYPVSVSGNKLLSSQISDEGIFPVVDQGKRFIAGYTDDESLLIRVSGPVVVFGDHTTERKYVDFDFVAGADGVKILRPVLQDEKFFWWQLVGLKLEGRGYARHFKVLNDALFALPPKSEQSRIVTKVDELMTLCDHLEARQSDAESAHARLVQALLDSLTQASDAADFAASWQRLSAHFHSLFTSESSIDALKQTLLQLAVMGKLVAQDPSDEPASELLKRIAEERARLVAAGQLKKHKQLEHVTENEKDFPPPKGWVWTRFGATIQSLNNGLYKPAEFYTESGVISLRMYNIQDGSIVFSDIRRVETDIDEINQYSLHAGDLLINRVNSKDLVGKTAVIPEVDEPLVYESMNMRARPFAGFVDSSYLNLFMRTRLAKDALLSHAKEAVGQASLNQGQISGLAMPLPPLAEQHRIVAKLDELLSLCDQLKSRLTTARQLHERLAGALVEQAVA